MNKMRKSFSQIHNQRGSVMVISLLVLLILTILGLASVTNNLTQERMTHDMKDINIAFQSAESALRYGEVWTENQALVPVPKPQSNCDSSCDDNNDVWVNDDVSQADLFTAGWWATNARAFGKNYENGGAWPTSSQLDGLTPEQQPRYVNEFFRFEPDSLSVGIAVPTGRYMYQLSARGQGKQATTETRVQSIYAKQF